MNDTRLMFLCWAVRVLALRLVRVSAIPEDIAFAEQTLDYLDRHYTDIPEASVSEFTFGKVTA